MRNRAKKQVAGLIGALMFINAQSVMGATVTGIETEKSSNYTDYKLELTMSEGETLSFLEIQNFIEQELGYTVPLLNTDVFVPLSPYIALTSSKQSIVATSGGSDSIVFNNVNFAVTVEIEVDGNSKGDNTLNNSVNKPTDTEQSNDKEQGLIGSGTGVEDNTSDSTSDSTSDNTNDNVNDNANDNVTNNEQDKETTNGGVLEPTTNTEYFTDISHRGWAVSAVNNMASKGYLKGVGNQLFKPDNNCKRADFVIATVRMLDLKMKEYKTVNYTDIVGDEYYSTYIRIAIDNGLISNTGTFRPNDYITREEASNIIYKGLIGTGKVQAPITHDLTMYADKGDIGAAYQEGVSALTQAKVMVGTSTKFEPKARITRGQMAVLLDNTYQWVNRAR